MTRVSSGVDRRPILVDPAADAGFREQGFAVVPFVDPEQLSELRAAVLPLIPEDAGPFFGLYRNDQPELRRRIDSTVRSLMQPIADRLMCNHRFYIGSLLVKYPGAGSHLDAHQDWSFVDETRHVSGIVWLPLQRTDQSNGGLSVVPGSHRFDLPYRGTPPESVAELSHDMVPCEMEPGEAVVYHNALIHGSSENRSSELRIAMVLGFVSAGADLLHYRTDESGGRWRYRVDEEHPFSYQPPDLPSGPSVLGVEKVVDEEPSSVAGPPAPSGAAGRVRRWFSRS